MASDGLSINSVVITIIALAIGVVLIGSLLAPIITDTMTKLTGMGDDGATWASLIGVVMIMAILGLVVVAINSYTRKSR